MNYGGFLVLGFCIFLLLACYEGCVIYQAYKHGFDTGFTLGRQMGEKSCEKSK